MAPSQINTADVSGSVSDRELRNSGESHREWVPKVQGR